MRRLKTQRMFQWLFAGLVGLVLMQNCSYPRVHMSGQNASPSQQQDGGTGADGKPYLSYAGDCSAGHAVASSSIFVSKGNQKATLVRDDCQDLSVPEQIPVSDLKFAVDDPTTFQWKEKIFDLQATAGPQKVTIEFCQANGKVQGSIWQLVGQPSTFLGGVTLLDGSGTGSLVVAAPTANHYSSLPGQASQLDLMLDGKGSGSLTYAINNGTTNSVPSLQCTSQSMPMIYDDGSAGAPAGPAQRPSMLSSYPFRPAWKVAGVDYAVGYSATQALKDPFSDPALSANANVSIDAANREIRINGDNVTLDGYDFTLNGHATLNVVTGNNTVVKNSKLGYVQSSLNSSNLTIVNCVIDGGAIPGQPLVQHWGTGTLTLKYNWIKNYAVQAVESLTGGNIVYRYNLIENGGMVAKTSMNIIQVGGGTFPSIDLQFNTVYQPPQPTVSESIPLGGAKSISGQIAFNTMLALATGGQSSMSYMIDVGDGVSPADFAIHDNYMDATGSYGPFYPRTDSVTTLTYTNNINLLTGSIYARP